jgi:glycosyltransferase involved in cell wall biosynthesis
LFEAGNIDDLVNKIKFLNERKELVGDLSKNCLQSSERLSIDNYYPQILDIYEKTIKEGSGLL